MGSRYLTPRQAAEFIGVSHEHLHRLIRQGALTAMNVGRGPKLPRWRVSVKDLEAFMESRRSRELAPRRRRRRPSRMDGVPEYV